MSVQFADSLKHTRNNIGITPNPRDADMTSQKKNHFASICRTKRHQRIHTVQDNVGDSSNTFDEEYAFVIHRPTQRQPRIDLLINGKPVNVMRLTTLRHLPNQPDLQKTSTKIFAYGASTPLLIVGIVNVTVTYKNDMTSCTFHVQFVWCLS